MKTKARILLFTGHGKGKTTASLGIVLRAAGHGIPTCVIQFLKGDASTGELSALESFPHVTVRQMGLGFVPPEKHPSFPTHRKAAAAALRKAQTAVKSRRDKVIVLDEICNAVAHKLISQKDAMALVKSAPGDKTLVLTGRNATPCLIALADTVTEMKCIKHGYEQGRRAQKGVEF